MAATLAVMRLDMADLIVKMRTAAQPEPKQKRVSTAARWLAPLLLLPGVTLASTSYDRARVVSSVPIYETVSYEVPVEECRSERVAHPPSDYSRSNRQRASVTGPILGAIIGGALGNAVGHKKRNKQVGAVVGAVLGGSIGADISRRHRERHDYGYGYGSQRVSYRNEQVCDVFNEVREEERLNGYDVTYVYGGKTYNTVMPHDPGRSMRVRVRVSPAQ